MLPQLLARSDDTPRERLFWALIATLVVGQLVAFWMLCSQQVRKAEARNASLQVERMAMADCLRYIPEATLNSCSTRVAPQAYDPNNVIAAGDGPGDGKLLAPTAISSAIPVSFTLR